VNNARARCWFPARAPPQKACIAPEITAPAAQQRRELMPTPEQDLKKRLATVLDDLHSNAEQSPETLWQLGALAADLSAQAGRDSWPALKQSLPAEAFVKLYEELQAHRQSFQQQGELRRVYALQTLGLSLEAHALRENDEQIREGETLLDAMIASAVGFFRSTQPKA
jgi:hypothetical protein